MTRRGILLVNLLVLGASQVLADNDQDAARRAVEDGQSLPFDRIIDRARREHPGQVLGVEIEAKGARLVYELRILAAGGQIGEWYYDARTGEPMGVTNHRNIPMKSED